MRIALDAMGGDFGVQPNIDGAITALKDNPDLHVTLVGDLSSIGPLVAKSGYPIDRLHLQWLKRTQLRLCRYY